MAIKQQLTTETIFVNQTQASNNANGHFPALPAFVGSPSQSSRKSLKTTGMTQFADHIPN